MESTWIDKKVREVAEGDSAARSKVGCEVKGSPERRLASRPGLGKVGGVRVL